MKLGNFFNFFACRYRMMSKLLNIFDDASRYFIADVEYEELKAIEFRMNSAVCSANFLTKFVK